jgi:hypothetical protein
VTGRLIISTQVTNVAVQKIWTRLGFEPVRSYYTVPPLVRARLMGGALPGKCVSSTLAMPGYNVDARVMDAPWQVDGHLCRVMQAMAREPEATFIVHDRHAGS